MRAGMRADERAERHVFLHSFCVQLIMLTL
jgi:hypothetical protein